MSLEFVATFVEKVSVEMSDVLNTGTTGEGVDVGEGRAVKLVVAG